MALSDCRRCWNTPCTCGWSLRRYTLPELHKHLRLLDRAIAYKEANPHAAFSESPEDRETEDDKRFWQALQKDPTYPVELHPTERAAVEILQEGAAVRRDERERLRGLLSEVLAELGEEFEGLPRPVKAETSYAYGMAAGLIMRVASRLRQKD